MTKPIPKVIFRPIKASRNVDIIKWTYNDDDKNLNLKNDTIKCFPGLKKQKDANSIIEQVVSSELNAKQKNIVEAVNHYQKIWDVYNDDFMEKLSKTLNICWPSKYSNIVSNVGIMPIYPRDINERTFDLSYWFNDDSLIDSVAHECCHFLYFEKWKQLYPDYNEDEFEYPHIIWELSEMVIDPILNKKEIKDLFNRDFKSYDYFYTDNTEEMKKIKDIYANNSIENSIRLSYDYINSHRNV